jgi:hypothetical protein
MHRMYRWGGIRLSVAAIVVAALAATIWVSSGCAREPQPPDASPAVRGVVTSVDVAGELVSMRVVWTDDAAVGPQASYDAAQVAVGPEAFVFDGTGDGDARRVDRDALAVGQVVEAWFDGPVAESYPVQAGATHVLIVGRYQGELPVPPGLEPPPSE